MTEVTQRPIKRALISVYDKTGLVELAQGLHEAGVSIVSTGSTAARIDASGVPVTKVEDLTGFPECLDGRVKTLHPRVHAGILADLRKADHATPARRARASNRSTWSLVNLYPFTQTVASGASPDECIEQIDIGGPSMVRAAAKNHPSVAVVVSPDRYGEVLDAVAAGGFTLEQRRRLALEAFVHTGTYDVAVASWMGSTSGSRSERSGLSELGRRHLGSRRRATVRRESPPARRAVRPVATARMVLRRLSSYTARRCRTTTTSTPTRPVVPRTTTATHAVAIIKHANPCGIAIDIRSDIAAAYRKAFDCDPVSAFGGVVAANRAVTRGMAEAIGDVFTEVIVAPDFEDAALDLLREKKNVRLLRAACRSGRRVGRDPIESAAAC